jgi:hypothetical protein
MAVIHLQICSSVVEMQALVWNGEAVRYSLSYPHNQQKEPNISRDEMEQRILNVALIHCNYSVAPSYVKDEIINNPLLVILEEGATSKGFIMARPLMDYGVYLDVICSAEGTGSAFLQFFLQYCESQGAAYVELSSLINVLAYYPNFGFEHRKECKPGKGANIGMSKELLDHLKQGKKEKRLQEYTNYYKDPYIMKFVADLHKRGYTKTKNPSVCTTKHLSVPRFRQYHCGRDGFTMRKCYGIPVIQADEIVPFEPIGETVKPELSVGTMRRAMGVTRSKSSKTVKSKTFKKRPSMSMRELSSLGVGVAKSNTRTVRIRI